MSQKLRTQDSPTDNDLAAMADAFEGRQFSAHELVEIGATRRGSPRPEESGPEVQSLRASTISMSRPYDCQLRFRRADFDRIPAGAYGVYGLWFGRRCIYVGKARDQSIAARLEQHWRGAKNPELAAWVQAEGSALRIVYVSADQRSDVDDLEKFYIRRFQPLTNKVLYDTNT